MGGVCGSYSPHTVELIHSPQFKRWNRVFKALSISLKDVDLLYQKFLKVDLDRSGNIDVVELLTLMDVARTPFTERVFKIFDEDRSGKIDFFEFVLSLWNYCTLSNATLAMFAFDLYDRNSSGFLEERDISLMMRDIYGKEANINPNLVQAQRDLHRFLDNPEVSNLTSDKFLRFVEFHQSLLFPAFEMQFALQNNILGVSFWERCAKRRVELSANTYLTMQQIIELEAHQTPFHILRALSINTSAARLAVLSLGTAHNRRENHIFPEEEPSPSKPPKAPHASTDKTKILDHLPPKAAQYNGQPAVRATQQHSHHQPPHSGHPHNTHHSPATVIPVDSSQVDEVGSVRSHHSHSSTRSHKSHKSGEELVTLRLGENGKIQLDSHHTPGHHSPGHSSPGHPSPGKPRAQRDGLELETSSRSRHDRRSQRSSRDRPPLPAQYDKTH